MATVPSKATEAGSGTTPDTGTIVSGVGIQLVRNKSSSAWTERFAFLEQKQLIGREWDSANGPQCWEVGQNGGRKRGTLRAGETTVGPPYSATKRDTRGEVEFAGSLKTCAVIRNPIPHPFGDV